MYPKRSESICIKPQVNFDKYKLLNMKLKGMMEKVHLIMQNFMWSEQLGTLGALKGPFAVTVEPL